MVDPAILPKSYAICVLMFEIKDKMVRITGTWMNSTMIEFTKNSTPSRIINDQTISRWFLLSLMKDDHKRFS